MDSFLKIFNPNYEGLRKILESGTQTIPILLGLKNPKEKISYHTKMGDQHQLKYLLGATLRPENCGVICLPDCKYEDDADQDDRENYAATQD